MPRKEIKSKWGTSSFVSPVTQKNTSMKDKDFLSNVPTTSVLHIFICADCTSLLCECKSFHICKTTKNKRPSTLVNQQFPVACRLSETMLWHSAAHFLPPFASSMISTASFLSHARTSESTADAVKQLYITFLVSDTGSRTDTNSRAASKWRKYNFQATNNHASAPPSRLQQLFLL